MPLLNDSFAHRLVRLDRRLILEAVCLRCGASKVVSASDGTLEEYHETHRCPDAPEPQPAD